MAIGNPPKPDVSNLLLGLGSGVLTTVAFGVGCFLLVYNAQGYMGWTLFLLIPFATGFGTALVARGRNVLVASLILGLLFCTGILLAMGFEGWVCVLMSVPLLVVGLTIGGVLGWLIRIYVIDKARSGRVLTFLMVFVLPLLVMGTNWTEQVSRGPRMQSVSDTLLVDSTPEVVWNELTSMESISARKTFLMKIGLPVPVSCRTEGERVGGKRTCYFEHGFIGEQITEWNFPSSMKFKIVESEVPGRPWLGFEDASYTIARQGNQTVITRTTTIVSRLAPAWYWRRLEAIGVHTEHEYLFEGLRNKLRESK